MPARDMVAIETQNDVDLPAETADERVRGAAKYCQIGTPAAKALFTQLLETWIAILITLRYSQLFALPWWCRWWSQCRLCVYWHRKGPSSPADPAFGWWIFSACMGMSSWQLK